jgi:hypothetical protein
MVDLMVVLKVGTMDEMLAVTTVVLMVGMMVAAMVD